MFLVVGKCQVSDLKIESDTEFVTIEQKALRLQRNQREIRKQILKDVQDFAVAHPQVTMGDVMKVIKDDLL